MQHPHEQLLTRFFAPSAPIMIMKPVSAAWPKGGHGKISPQALAARLVRKS